MYTMLLTMKIKLIPTEDQKMFLLESMERFNVAWIWEWLTFPIRLTALIPHLIAALATLWILAKQRSPELTFEGWR